MIAIIEWLINIAKAIGYWFQEIFREAIKFTTTAWGVIVLVVGLAYAAMLDTVGAINSVVVSIDGFTSNGPSLTAPSGIGGMLAIANTFTPLDEVFQYASAFLIVLLGVGIYRLIKSWIPTMSGGG